MVNLKELYGKKYRVRVGPEHEAERGTDVKRAVDPWHYYIPAASWYLAHVFPWSDDRLAVSRDRKIGNSVNRELLSLPTTRIEQDGDDGVTISFELSDFDAVAKRLELLKRVVLTEARKSALAERVRQFLNK